MAIPYQCFGKTYQSYFQYSRIQIFWTLKCLLDEFTHTDVNIQFLYFCPLLYLNYILHSPNCKRVSSSKMLIQKKKVLLRSKHVPLIWVKLKCLPIFLTEYSVSVPYRVWKVSFSYWCSPITEKLKDTDWKTQNVRKCLLWLAMLNSQQQTKFLVTSLFADLIFSNLTTSIFNFSFSLPFYMRNMYSAN